MMSTATATMVKMMESLPESYQNLVVERVRSYIEELQEEIKWEIAFKKTQTQLVAAARRAKQEIAQGLAEPMDYNRL